MSHCSPAHESGSWARSACSRSPSFGRLCIEAIIITCIPGVFNFVCGRMSRARQSQIFPKCLIQKSLVGSPDRMHTRTWAGGDESQARTETPCSMCNGAPGLEMCRVSSCPTCMNSSRKLPQLVEPSRESWISECLKNCVCSMNLSFFTLIYMYVLVIRISYKISNAAQFCNCGSV